MQKSYYEYPVRNHGIRVARCIVITLLVSVLVIPVISHTGSAKLSDTETEPRIIVPAQPAKASRPAKDQADFEKPHLLAASYYSLQPNLKASLTLNHKGPYPLEVTPTLFDLDGNRLDIPSVSVDANSFRVFDLSRWAAIGGAAFQQGSLQLFYKGKDLLLGAQVKLIDSDSSLIFDEQLVEPAAKFASSRLEGVWWLPSRQSQLSLVLSNTTDGALELSVAVDGKSPKQQEPTRFKLQPHETRMIPTLQNLTGESGGMLLEVGGISIQHSGPKGALLARGMIQDAAIGYSSSVQFSDPLMSRSSRLHGAGLRLGKVANDELRPVIVARNIGSVPSVISGRIPFSSSDGSMDLLPIGEARLRPGEARVLKLNNVIERAKREQIISAGLEIEYDSEPGSIIVSTLSASRSGNQVFQVPMLDPDAQKSSTGGYPWSIEDSSWTVVCIKNVTDQPQQYVAYLNSTGGDYMMGLKTIEPRQTAVIDIRALRDNQTPDEEGKTIPPDAMSGQFKWNLIQTETSEPLVLIGRAEQADTQKAISSSYACQNCCTSYVSDAFVSPSYVEMQATNTIRFQAYQTNIDCYGNPYTFSPITVSWSSSDGNVATVNSSGNATARRGGETTIKASWNAIQYQPPPQPCGGPYSAAQPNLPNPCGCFNYSVALRPTATLRVIPRVTISAAQTIMDGSNASFSIQSPDATPTSINWSSMAPPGAGNSPNVTFSPNGNAMTTTNGRWFALPNSVCAASFDAVYEIRCTAQFSLGFNISVTVGSTLTVNALWNPAGFVASPVITGGPTIGFDLSRNLWVVTGSGNLQRVVQSPVINVPSTSQFYAKTVAHENRHIQQWQTGMLSDLLQVSSLMAQLSPLTDPTEAGLRSKLNADSLSWFNSQEAIYNSRLTAAEDDAHAISDPIAPMYLYQRACNRH